MAASGYTPISLYYSATASAAPSGSNLVAGELAINTNDGKLYYKDSSNVVQVIASKATGTLPGASTQVIYNSGGTALAGSANLTFDGTKLTVGNLLNSGLSASSAVATDASKNLVSVTNTGTGNNVLSASPTFTGTAAFATLTSSALTNGRVTVAGASGQLTDYSTLQFDGTNLGIGATPVSSKGQLQIGAIGYTDTGVLAGFASSTAGYNQIVLQNTSNNAAASTNFNVSNDAGTATTNFGEFGINSSTFTGTGSFSTAGYTYLASGSTDLAIGTYGNNKIHFVVNSGATDAAVFDTSGNFGIGQATPGSKLDVKGTIRLSGSSSGYVGLAPAAAAGSTTYVLPAADGTSGQFLKTDGSANLSWATASGGGTPGGANTQVQFNNSGVFGGSANLTWDGTTFTAGTAAISVGNLTFSTTGQRIVGDFSNATVSSRTNFITGTTNGSTGIYALPNGTATAASWQATNAADPTNASKVLIATNGSTDVQLVSGINGTGTYLPLSIVNGGLGRFVFGTSGQFGIGPVASVSYGTAGQVLTSGGPSAAPTWAAATGGGPVANSCIYLNNLSISSSYTITTGQGAHSVGPITVASGAVLTVASGSRYVIA